MCNTTERQEPFTKTPLYYLSMEIGGLSRWLKDENGFEVLDLWSKLG